MFTFPASIQPLAEIVFQVTLFFIFLSGLFLVLKATWRYYHATRK